MSYKVLKSFQKNVTTAGTAVQLTTTKIIGYGVRIKAKAANTGDILVGSSSAVSTTTGYRLDAAEKIDATEMFGPEAQDAGVGIDLSQVWLNSTVNAEGVEVLYFETAYG